MFAGHHHVDVIPGAQAVVEYRQQTVGIRRQVNPDDVGLLVDHMVEKSGILMGEAIVVLLPDMGGEKVVQGRDLSSPGQLGGDLQPLGVLTEHRIHDANERLIAVEEAVPPGQQIAFQPALALMLAEHGIKHAA